MLTCTFVQEVSQQTAHDSLVADNQHIPLAFQLHDYWFQALHQVLVRLQGERKDRIYYFWERLSIMTETEHNTNIW